MATKTRNVPAPAPVAQEAAPASIEDRALSYLKVVALESILSSPEPLRITDLARLVIERLGMSLDEHEAGGLASVVRLLLDSDPRFAQSSRRWDLALRMGRADADRKKPVERSIEDFIDHLRECKESVAYFGLTLESLLSRLILPEWDRPIFIKRIQERLGLGSTQERLADRL